MLIILSPAKSLNFECKVPKIEFSNPQFLSDTKILVNQLKKLSKQQIAKLMQISEKLADLNYNRFQNFSAAKNNKNSKPAIFVFNGDVYDGIDVENYKKLDLDFAQKHLRILSGLYGILRPLDLIEPYRLEMGTQLRNERGKNLYQFWLEKIDNNLNVTLEDMSEDTLINLASEEYYNVINPLKINAKIINIVFKEKKNSDYKIIGLFAKKARGLMADFIIKNHITKPSLIKDFSLSGYKFMPKFSDENNWHFYR